MLHTPNAIVRVEIVDPAARLATSWVRAVGTSDPHGCGADLLRVQVFGDQVSHSLNELRMVVWSRNAENVFQFQLQKQTKEKGNQWKESERTTTTIWLKMKQRMAYERKNEPLS